MSQHEDRKEPCGAPHPDDPEMTCERVVCVVYHRSGHTTWTQGAAPLPGRTGDPQRMADILRRTSTKNRRPAKEGPR